MRRNGNGGKGGNGEGGSVPRWVRTLFDPHEACMAAHGARMSAHEKALAAHGEAMAAHDARMDEMDRFMRTVQREEIETRRQTREIVLEIGRIDRERAADRAAAAKERVEFVAALGLLGDLGVGCAVFADRGGRPAGLNVSRPTGSFR